MTTVTQIEASILKLPKQSFIELLGWMNDRSKDFTKDEIEYESPELEEEMLKALNGPRLPINEDLYDGIRRRWKAKQLSKATQSHLQAC